MAIVRQLIMLSHAWLFGLIHYFLASLSLQTLGPASVGTILGEIADSHGSRGILCKHILLISFHISFDFICAFALKTLIAEALLSVAGACVYRFREHVIAAQRIIFVHFKWFASNNSTANYYQDILSERERKNNKHTHAWMYMVNMRINSALFM